MPLLVPRFKSSRHKNGPKATSVGESPAAARSTKPESHQPLSSLAIALASGLAGAVLSLFGQYFVTYKYIEGPKYELEARKLQVEALKSIQALTPHAELVCTVQAISQIAYLAECTATNKGDFAIEIQAEDARFYLRSNYKSTESPSYSARLQFEERRRGKPWLPVPPKQARRSLLFLELDEKHAKELQNQKWALEIDLALKTDKRVSEAIGQAFPSLAGATETFSRVSATITVPQS